MTGMTIYKTAETDQEFEQAKELYESFGFQAIEPYYFNPIQETIYMERVI